MLARVKSLPLSPESLQKPTESLDGTVVSSSTFSDTPRASGTCSPSTTTCAWTHTSFSAQPEQSVGNLACAQKKQYKVKKKTFWGIQVVEALVWKNWELGKEAIRHLTLKNISMKIQKLKYRLPTTKFFFTVYPQSIFLSPGMSFTLPVFFRPLEEKEYVDHLSFVMAEGEFSIELRACLPSHQLTCLSTLQMPLCAVSDTTETWFSLYNVGDLPTFFTWEVPNPFHTLPSTGLLEPGSVCQIKLVFQPHVALIYDVQGICWYGEAGDQKTTIQIQAVAKCPQIMVYVNRKEDEEIDPVSLQKVVDFGPAPVGYSMKKCIQLFNPSLVNAPFRIETHRILYADDRVFSSPTTKGVVKAGDELWLPLLFRPQTVGLKSIDYFTIFPPGNTSEVTLKITGSCTGPALSLSSYCVDFNWINLGECAMKSLMIRNDSDCPGFFMFEIDNQASVFSVEPQSGVLASKEHKMLTITFQPTHTIICYRRVACLIHHQEPLFLDIIGTCHSDTNKPAILRPRHLKWYRTHMARGMILFAPDILGTMLREKKFSRDEDGALMLRQEASGNLPPAKYPSIPPLTEYFLDGTSDTVIFPPTVTIEPLIVNFGKCSSDVAPDPVPLCLTNHTRGTITVTWTHKATGPFRVEPDTIDIPPLKNTAARLCFQPQFPNKIYVTELEAFAFYRVLRSFNNIEEDCTVFPSWCLKLRAMGHTYKEENEYSFPRYTLDVPKLFPAVSSKCTSYRTLLLFNSGSLMLSFEFLPSSSPEITVRPTSGYLLPGAYQIFLLSIIPKGFTWKQLELALQFNFCPKYIKEVILMSREEPLDIQMESGKVLYFKPTYIGGSSTMPYKIRNTTRLTLTFEWKYTFHSSKVVSVQPSKGTILPNETMIHTWTFTPNATMNYLIRAVLWVWDSGAPCGPPFPSPPPSSVTSTTLPSCMAIPSSIPSSTVASSSLPSKVPLSLAAPPRLPPSNVPPPVPSNSRLPLSNDTSSNIPPSILLPSGLPPSETSHYVLKLIGEGIKASITAKEKELDFGNVLVDSEQRKEMILLNDGNCTLHYRLFVEQTLSGPCDPDVMKTDPIILKLEKMEGMLCARSQETICLTACPTRRLQYTWTIKCCLLTRKDGECSKREVICKATMKGVYPTLSILDACGMGSAGGITRQHLWRLFSLETLNSYLERDPTSWELTYRVPTRHSTSRIPSVYTPLLLDFNFGAAPIGTEPSVVFLLLKNSGVVPLNWSFLFPSDQQIDLEFWAERTEFDFTELHQMRVQDNDIFSIIPKSGNLQPGQEQTVEFIYRHIFAGTDKLPVLLKVSNGREILLNFVGVTVKAGEKYVHFTSVKHRFTPVTIGTSLPPRQIFELYNGGSVPVLYDIQLDVLWNVQNKNFQHPIFQCLNPHGDIQPGKTTQVFWIFSPIEAKTYAVDVPIHILGWNSAIIRFEGVGYDRFIMGNTAPFHSITTTDQTPAVTRLIVPGQVAFLSQSRISLGNIPVCSRSSRLIFLNNASEKDPIIFSWDLEASSIIENVILKVSPMMGMAAPGENIPCVVTMDASQHACFYSLDLVCKVYLQKALSQYEIELQAWEKEKARQEVEFTITENNLEGLLQFQSSGTFCAICDPGRKYKTLPPIQKQQPYTPPVTWNLRNPKTGQIWLYPEEPKPCLLYLGLSARAHNMDDFLRNFFSQSPRFFFCPPLEEKKSEGESIVVEDEPDQNTFSNQEKQIVRDILTIIIRGLLEDRKFHEDVQRGLVEAIPYFSQFWSEDSVRMQNQKDSSGHASVSPSYEGEEEEAHQGEDKEDETGEEESWDKGKIFESLDGSLSPTNSIQKRGLGPVLSEMNSILQEENSRIEKETISRLPSFLNLRQSILENIIQNIMIEASRGEVVLTTKPRVIALPPQQPLLLASLSSLADLQREPGDPVLSRERISGL
ncbi:cilia- and flagella-associated protein 65 isoform X2 [Monodelphis domestica]|uniref:cilia- and flagella-associated protein 65 isoform X2 n=1 Tax=Monodelphis domestica TaxID=13616 RepID=UPI0024E1F372|nr:cilia- and flagella-associated protein 65 isoform X2 [Monodelphis domestica]